jgi:prepilin-type N-terminal cleavage/methylation domain-containing protein
MGKRGFTLLEVVIAVAIIAAGVIVVGSSWSGNLLRLRTTNLYSNIAYLLEKKMHEVELKYKDQPIDSIPEEEEGDFGKDYANFRWVMKSRNFEMPDISSLIAGEDQQPDEATNMMVTQMSDFMKSAVKEVQVIVFAKVKEKEVKFSVSTYFVNYNAELAIPGLSGGADSGAKDTGAPKTPGANANGGG